MTARILASELADELRILVREPMALLFSVAMPVGFFALFATLYGRETAAGGLTVGTSMLATFGTFGVVGAAMLNPGISIATERETGWLRAKRVSAMSPAVAVGTKAAASLPYAVGVVLAMTAVTQLNGTLVIDAGTWLRLVGVLILGTVPFALLGLAVGFVASGQATTAILNAFLMPAAVASGLWMPFEILPTILQRIGPLLPTYHLAQLGLAQMDGSPAGLHVIALGLWTAGAALLAAVAYRRSRP